MRQLLAMALTVLALTAAPTRALGPGQPFGGDDTGCVPSNKNLATCSGTAVKAFAKLVGSVITCHIKQADIAFKVHNGGTGTFDEDACEDTDPVKSAKAKFDAALTKLDGTGLCAGTPVIANAQALEAVLLADRTNPASLDAQNGGVYCDSASSAQIDPSGDDAGFISNSKDNLKCADTVAKNVSKLIGSVIKCHMKAAATGLKSGAFDEEACEDADFCAANPATQCHTDADCPAGDKCKIKSAAGTYKVAAQKLVAKAICPGCLDQAGQTALGASAVGQLEAANGQLYFCATTTTSTSVTTSTSSSTSTSTSTSSTTLITLITLSTTTSTSTSTSSTTSTSSSTSTTTSTSSTSTTAPVSKLTFTFGPGTTSCGSTGLTTGPSAPLSGALFSDVGGTTKIVDLGLSCLYFGGGHNLAVAGSDIPSGSSQTFAITGTAGSMLTLGASPGTGPLDCTKAAGPGKHCIGSTNFGLMCTTDANCNSGNSGSCAPDANCFFGPPLPLPNASLPPISTCVFNVFATDGSGSADTASGALSATLPLASRVYFTGTSYGSGTPCPRCLNNACTSGHCAGIATGKVCVTAADCTNTCNGGKRGGLVCAPEASKNTSFDCPPQDAEYLTTLSVPIAATTASSVSTNATGQFCPLQQAGIHAGAFGKNAARNITEGGTPAAGGITTTPHAAALGATFCVPATGNGTIDPSADLPGPGAIGLAGTAKLQ